MMRTTTRNTAVAKVNTKESFIQREPGANLLKALKTDIAESMPRKIANARNATLVAKGLCW